MTTINVGHQDTMTIQYLDQNGNPLLTTPTPDSAPTWTNAPTPSGDDTLSVAQGGNSAVLAAVAAGTDLVTLTVVVGGKTFSATDAITITPAPQVLTSVAIVDSVV